ncbi:MAG TPA: tetratricopeptide repeat protein [Aggregicoccus sp.]|nr:tetratricopeptide repeat protein [Aggregicoccus sp.]
MAQRSPRKPPAVKKAPVKQPAAKKPASKPRPPAPQPAPRAAPAAKAPAARKAQAAPPALEAHAEPPRPALPAGEAARERTLPFELDPRRLEEGLKSLQGELVHWANKGRYTRVRFKFRGKQLLPDLPLAAVVAAEGLTFYWGGILRALLFNVAGKSVLSVELVNDADKRVQLGKECLLSGEVEEALAHFREALAMDRDHAAAQLNLGVAYKLQGRRDLARAALEMARQKDPEGAVGAEAERLLKGLAAAGPQAG